MDAAVENFRPSMPSTLQDMDAHITRALLRANVSRLLEIGGANFDRAAMMAQRDGRYVCVRRHDPDAFPEVPDNSVMLWEDPDWWCGGDIDFLDAALVTNTRQIRRFEQLLEVIWNQLQPGAMLIVAEACAACPQEPAASDSLRTAAQLHTSLTYAGFMVISMEDALDGVVFGARRT
ncbi:hypothetical protein [Roseibium sp.]|uniref:hypothetical protein n=1 Tax=Roseibium sp. TaxID=1936156 RepID=UPI0032658AB3